MVLTVVGRHVHDQCMQDSFYEVDGSFPPAGIFSTHALRVLVNGMFRTAVDFGVRAFSREHSDLPLLCYRTNIFPTFVAQ